MRPRRRSSLTESFTFGGRIPGSVGLLLVVILIASVLGWQNRAIQGYAAFYPDAILRGELWRLVTWVFVQDHPMTLLFGGFMVWSFGGQLSYVWGERRFVLRFLGYTAGAAVLATLVALVWPAANVPHLGLWPTVNALLASWALIYPSQQVNIWGVLPLTGRTLALLVAFGTVLYGVFAGFGAFLLHLCALGIAWGMASQGLAFRRTTRRWQGWWADREARRRAKHLKVVHRDGEKDDRPRWMN
ncbi:MAG TPA: rhomboid family intramembrane serine protease [Anaeromyxobacteraceae bacterium]|nr:rhomboid family intramembrane serine protease [Anaeromyxobacteraceae bacterium]